MLRVDTNDRGDFVYLSLNGRLDGSPCCKSLAAEVKTALHEGKRQFVFDMTDLEWLNSCGIGCLISIYVSVKREQGSVLLLSPNSRVLASLTATNLVPTIFQVVESHVHHTKPA